MYLITTLRVPSTRSANSEIDSILHHHSAQGYLEGLLIHFVSSWWMYMVSIKAHRKTDQSKICELRWKRKKRLSDPVLFFSTHLQNFEANEVNLWVNDFCSASSVHFITFFLRFGVFSGVIEFYWTNYTALYGKVFTFYFPNYFISYKL